MDLFSKISGFLKSGRGGQEVQASSRSQKSREYDHERKGRRDPGFSQDREEGSAEGDVTLLSVEAIRVMIISEETLGGRRDEIVRKLSRLEQAGFKSIPVAEGQSVIEAVETALSFASGA